jgi:Nup133 N terminal like
MGGVGNSMSVSTTASATATTEKLFREYWNNDFVPLQDAGAVINAALRADEQDADLYRKIVVGANSSARSGGGGSGTGSSSVGAAHLYFPYDSNTQPPPSVTPDTTMGPPTPSQSEPAWSLLPPPPPEQYLQHLQSVPLPSLLSQQLTMARMYSNMGLLSAAHLAWMSVDEKLYLWSYHSNHHYHYYATTSLTHPIMNGTDTTLSSSSSFCSFVIPSGQCVISVGLVKPKKGTSFFLLQTRDTVVVHVCFHPFKNLTPGMLKNRYFYTQCRMVSGGGYT